MLWLQRIGWVRRAWRWWHMRVRRKRGARAVDVRLRRDRRAAGTWHLSFGVCLRWWATDEDLAAAQARTWRRVCRRVRAKYGVRPRLSGPLLRQLPEGPG